MKQFCDLEFPASGASLGEGIDLKGVAPNDVPWARAQALLPPGEIPQLFNRIEPDDILQGRCGASHPPELSSPFCHFHSHTFLSPLSRRAR